MSLVCGNSWPLAPHTNSAGPEQPWRKDGRGRNPLHNKIDDLSMKYSMLADDSSTEARKREASLLFCSAEGHLEEEEVAEALTAAIAALRLFRELNDSNAVHDTLRVILNAQRMEASLQYEDKPVEAERLACQELKTFEGTGDRRGQAAMLLSLVECLCDGKDVRESFLNEAELKAKQALELFKAVQDDKMSAIVLLELAHISAMRNDSEQVSRKAAEARGLFQRLGDVMGDARALHGMAVASIIDRNFADAVSKMRAAAGMFRELGAKKHEAFELCVMAEVHLEEEKPHRALPAAREALGIFQRINYGRGWEAASLYAVIRAHLAQEQADLGVKAARQGLQRFRDASDRRQEIYGHLILADALVASGNASEALDVCRGAKEVLEDMEDKRMEIAVLHATMWVHIQNGGLDKAMDQMDDALFLAQELGSDLDEAVAAHNMAFLHLQKGQHRQAVAKAKEAGALFKKGESKKGEAGALMIAAASCSDFSLLDSAQEKCSQARELYRSARERHGECEAWSMLAELKMRSGDLIGALASAASGVESARQLRSKRSEARSLLLLGRLQLEGKELDSAEATALQAKMVASAAEDRLEMTQAQLLLTQVLLAQAEGQEAPDDGPHPLEKAMKSVTEAVTLSGRCNDRGLVAISRFVHGRLLFGTGRVPEAQRLAEEALRWFRKAEDPLGEAKTLLLQGDVALETNENEQARALAEEARAMASVCGSAETQAEAEELLGRIESKRKRPEASLQQQLALVTAASPGAQVATTATPTEAAGESVALQSKGLDPIMVKAKVLEVTKDLVSSGDDELELDSPFMEAGMDSLSSVQLISELSKEFQLAMSPSLVFDYPTVASLSDHLVEESMEGKY